MRRDVWIVTVVELGLATGVIALLAASLQLGWLGAATSAVSGTWVANTHDFFDGTLVTERPTPPAPIHADPPVPGF